MTVLPASEARAGLSELLNRVAFGGERIVLERHGRHVAALVSMKDFARLEVAEGGARTGKSAVVRYDVRVYPGFGTVLLAATERGVCRVLFGRSRAGLSALLRSEAPGALPGRAPLLRRASAELSQFFAGRRREFTVPVDPDAYATPFARRVLLEATRAIPFGTVRTYGDVAAAIGSPAAARAVGGALAANPVPILVPCHRVIAAGGRLGGYSGGPPGRGLDWKRNLLKREGALPDAA
ncbi:MAG: type II toxin-antitoxin system prevent-host-death family antitoxin [Acidobacteriota bacterium]